jgi:hypothetical protein
MMFIEVEVARARVSNGKDANAIKATQMMTTLRGFRKPSEFFISLLLQSYQLHFAGQA